MILLIDQDLIEILSVDQGKIIILLADQSLIVILLIDQDSIEALMMIFEEQDLEIEKEENRSQFVRVRDLIVLLHHLHPPPMHQITNQLRKDAQQNAFVDHQLQVTIHYH